MKWFVLGRDRRISHPIYEAMPYKDPERKRQWEQEHREERNSDVDGAPPPSGNPRL